MNEVLQFLKDNPIFYIATIDGEYPRVRPFGVIAEHENRLYLCTDNEKNIYRQLQENPYIELCASSHDGVWLRLYGMAKFDNNLEAKTKILKDNPGLNNIYSIKDDIMEVFYIDSATATFFTTTGQARKIKL